MFEYTRTRKSMIIGGKKNRLQILTWW